MTIAALIGSPLPILFSRAAFERGHIERRRGVILGACLFAFGTLGTIALVVI